MAIHRIVEQRAAGGPERIAVVDGSDSLTYRDLNHRANAVARHLMAQGFKRGGRAFVRMPRGIDLAVVLLAVLKAGGSYVWSDPERSSLPCPPGFTFITGPTTGHSHQGDDGDDEQHAAIDLRAALSCRGYNPNLPVVTRPSDVACVIEGSHGRPEMPLPHATVVSLTSQPLPQLAPWVGEPGALDLWCTLMAGATAQVEELVGVAAAA